jgi:hypothetical protein
MRVVIDSAIATAGPQTNYIRQPVCLLLSLFISVTEFAKQFVYELVSGLILNLFVTTFFIIKRRHYEMIRAFVPFT